MNPEGGMDESQIADAMFGVESSAESSDPAPADVDGLESDVDAYNEAAGADEYGYDDGYYDAYAEDGDYVEADPHDAVREMTRDMIREELAPFTDYSYRDRWAEADAARAEQAEAAYAQEHEAVSAQVDEAIDAIGRREGLGSDENKAYIKATADHIFDQRRQELVAQGAWEGLSYETRVELARQALNQAAQDVKSA